VSEPNTVNIALANYFYNSDNDGSIDELLTVKEARYATLIKQLRQGLGDNDKSQIDEFVNHLIIRTRNIRVTASASGEAFIEIIFDELFRPENKPLLEKMMLRRARKHPDIRKLLNSLPQGQREGYFHHTLKPLLTSPENFAMELFTMLLAKFQLDLSEAAANAQLKALAQFDQTLRNRADLVKNIQWSICPYERHALILGDLGPIAKGSDSDEWRSALIAGEPSIICLPISDQLLLVGGQTAENQPLNPEEVNCASAELSAEYFVASQNTSRENGYRSRIGNRSRWAGQKEMREIVQAGGWSQSH
jgi:hypothetical protein